VTSEHQRERQIRVLHREVLDQPQARHQDKGSEWQQQPIGLNNRGLMLLQAQLFMALKYPYVKDGQHHGDDISCNGGVQCGDEAVWGGSDVVNTGCQVVCLQFAQYEDIAKQAQSPC